MNAQTWFYSQSFSGRTQDEHTTLLLAPTPPGTFLSVDGANDWLARYRRWFDSQRTAAIEQCSHCAGVGCVCRCKEK